MSAPASALPAEPSLVTPLLAAWLGARLPVGPLHGAASSTPVPHWVVLLLAVPALWLAVAVLVVVADRALAAV